MKYTPIVFSLVAAFMLFTVGSVSAAVSCQPIYGGGQTCIEVGKIVINKTILNPSTNTFVENLGINDPKHQPSSLVTFQLVVTNVSDSDISRINVVDTFPNFVNFSSGPGTFDTNTKTLSFSFDNLKRGESRTFTLQGTVVAANQLPADQGVVCVVNQVSAKSEPTGEGAQDNAQFCIEKQIIGVEVPGKGGPVVIPQKPVPPSVGIPKTGPELLPLVALIPMGALGAFLRKKTSL